MMDLPRCIESSTAQYADDSSVYRPITNNTDVSVLQKDLDSVSLWCKINEMSLNANKSSHLLVSKAHNPIKSSYNIDDVTIPTISNVKTLGLNISSDMKWNLQTDYVCAKAFKILGMLRRSLSGSRRVAMRSAYLSLVRPLILYATPAWHPITDANLKKLERVQSVATSLILGRDSYKLVNGIKHRINSDARNIMCNIPSITDVLFRHDVVFLHKCIMGEADLQVFSDSRITIRHKPSNLRGGDSTKLVVPRVTAAYYNNSCIPRSVNNYNSLSDSVKNLSVAHFKSALL